MLLVDRHFPIPDRGCGRLDVVLRAAQFDRRAEQRPERARRPS